MLWWANGTIASKQLEPRQKDFGQRPGHGSGWALVDCSPSVELVTGKVHAEMEFGEVG